MAVKASGRFVPPSAFAAGTGKTFTGAYAWNAPREAVGRERPLIASTLATSLSFEKRYTLNVIVTDFTGDFDLLIVPVLAWLRENQPDIMTTDAGQKKGFTFYADINNDSSFDISISLMLTERTLVSEVDGALHVKNIPEPTPPEPVTRPMELYINGELVSKWDE